MTRTAVTYEPFGIPVTSIFDSRSKAIDFMNCLIANEIYFEVQFVDTDSANTDHAADN